MSPAGLALFEWLPLVALASGRKNPQTGRPFLSGTQASVAIFVALTSNGTSGENAYVDAPRIAEELGVSERTVWRHFNKLCDLDAQKEDVPQWFVRTSEPVRPKAGEAKLSRRARYRLTDPRLDLALVTAEEPETPANMDLSHVRLDEPPTSDTQTPQRLTVSTPTSDIAPTDDGAVLRCGTTSNGSPNFRHPSASTTEQARDGEAGGVSVTDHVTGIRAVLNRLKAAGE